MFEGTELGSPLHFSILNVLKLFSINDSRANGKLILYFVLNLMLTHNNRPSNECLANGIFFTNIRFLLGLKP